MALDASYLYTDNTLTTSTAIVGKDASQLTMDDFFNLLVAQMTNQDMLNPTSDTEYIAQMAQFATLSAVQAVQEYQLSSYATSYVGKYVTIANVTSSGSIETITGMVEGVTFYDGSPMVIVNGESYDLYTVMEISASEELLEANTYMNKKVTIEYAEKGKDVVKDSGTVTKVFMKNGVVYVQLDSKTDKTYPFDSIVSSSSVVDDKGKDDNTEDITGDGGDAGDGDVVEV